MSVDVWEYAFEKQAQHFEKTKWLVWRDVESFFPPPMDAGDLYQQYWPRRPMTAEDLGINEMENVA
jgi:hypothetical protein